MPEVYPPTTGDATLDRVARPRKLLDQLRDVLRAKHYSYRTEQAYVHSARRYILFHGKRHPREMGAPEIERFLTYLAVHGSVSGSTQTQALRGLLFLYKHVLKIELPALDAVRARRPKRLPVVLSRSEVSRLLEAVDWAHGVYRMMAGLRLAFGPPLPLRFVYARTVSDPLTSQLIPRQPNGSPCARFWPSRRSRCARMREHNLRRRAYNNVTPTVPFRRI